MVKEVLETYVAPIWFYFDIATVNDTFVVCTEPQWVWLVQQMTPSL